MKRLAVPVFLALFLLSGFIGASLTQADFSAPPVLAYITAPPEARQATLPDVGLTVYAHLGHTTGAGWLAGGELSALDRLAAAGYSYQALGPLAVENGPDNLYVAHTMPGRENVDWTRHAVTFMTEQDWRLIRSTPAEAWGLAEAGVQLQRITLDPKPLASRAPAPQFSAGVVFDPAVQAMMDQVSSLMVYKHTGDLSGEWPVDIDGQPFTISTRNTNSGEPIQKATQFVGVHFADLGLDVEYHQWSGATYPNVIGEIAGLTNPEDIYIVSAHLDDMPSSGLAPGADDNASGTVAALIAADIFSQHQWGCTVRFGLWTGEEQGLLGSSAYAQRAFNAGENIAGVLNLDMIGWNTPSSSRTMDLHAKAALPGTIELAQLFADVIDVYSLDLIPEIVPNGSGASDHASFWQYGYPAIMGIEDFGDFNPYYHTANDRLANLDLDYFTEFVKASIGSFAHMSDCLIDCVPVQIVDVAIEANGCLVDFDPDVTGTAPISWDWSFQNGAPLTSTLESPAGIDFGISGTYAYTATAANCAGTGQNVFVDTVTVACEACTPLAGVALDQVTADPIYPEDIVTFGADVAPGDASTPYSYTVTVEGSSVLAGQSDADPLLFQHSFAGPGVYDLAVSVWNCDMLEPLTDALTVTVEAPCTPLSGVSLTQETIGDVYVGDPVTLSATIAPAGTTRPYSYTLSLDGAVIAGGQSSADTLDFQVEFDAAGAHTVTFSAWNCDMAEPMSDTLPVTVMTPAFTYYYPVIMRVADKPGRALGHWLDFSGYGTPNEGITTKRSNIQTGTREHGNTGTRKNGSPPVDFGSSLPYNDFY